MEFFNRRLIGSIQRTLTGYVLVSGILLLSPQVFCQKIAATSALLQGIITNGTSGVPIVGAKVFVNGDYTWSTSSGVYTLAVDPPGTYTVLAAKAGFDNFTSPPVIFQPGSSTALNIQLGETLNPPSDVSVFLDTISQHAPVSWNQPSGNYELLYDDGIQDNFTSWASQGNMNALRFTPVGFPVKVTGGSINIGAAGNYPSGSSPLVPFQIQIFDATGAGGMPGNSLAGPFEITPAALGWVEFTLPAPVLISNGAFYLAMVQGGNAPNAAGIAIDETHPRLRSYSRFVSGGGPWVPAGGNFMIRARCEGPGGPVNQSDELLTTGMYNIYRLRQGEEQNPSAWTMIGSTSAMTLTDSSWASLPCGPYRWGVKSQYPGNHWSPAAFSNILGKCWTTRVNIHLDLSCDSASLAGTYLHLVNLAYPDTLYYKAFDSGGTV
jgi:hypothetical protein